MIRPVCLKDVQALVDLEHLCFTQDRLLPSQFRQFIVRQNVILLIDSDHHQLVGYSLVLLRKNTTQARLYSFAVAPNYRGTGLATKLLLATEQEAKNRKQKKMILEVRKDNARAIHFYEKLNYHFLGEYKNFYEDHTDALRLFKDLTSEEI